MRIRDATAAELPSLRLLYNHYVESTHVTFETGPVSMPNRECWLSQFSRSGPHRLIVAFEGRSVIGYASSSPFHPKPVYASSVETSIYLARKACGNAFGTKLYGHLLTLLDAEEAVHRMYAGVTLPNDPSVALHRKLGFSLAGTLSEVPRKSGRFWDLCWFERSARDHG